MAAPHEPKGWGWNPSVITLCIVVATLLVGIAYYVGQKDAELRELRQAADKSERIAAEALKLATYATKEADVKSGHANPTTPKDNQKKEK